MTTSPKQAALALQPPLMTKQERVLKRKNEVQRLCSTCTPDVLLIHGFLPLETCIVPYAFLGYSIEKKKDSKKKGGERDRGISEAVVFHSESSSTELWWYRRVPLTMYYPGPLYSVCLMGENLHSLWGDILIEN